LFSAITLTLVVCGWLCPAGLAQQRPTKNVLMMHWSSEDFPSSPVIEGAIREALTRSGVPVAFFSEYLESDRFPDEAAALALRDYIRTKYRGLRIDVVLAQSNPALQFVLRHRDELFPGAPVVFTGVAVPGLNGQSPVAAVTGIISGPGFRETLALALRMQPQTERVFVVAESPGSPLREIVRAELDDFAQSGKLTFITDASVPRMIAAVEAIPPKSVILFVRHSQEAPGNPLRPTDVARLVAQASPVPVYGITDEVLGSGVVGGVMYTIRSVGTRMGEITAQLLNGARVEDIRIERAKHVSMFDWRQLQRWNIPESRVPVGSVILFKPPSFFEQHWEYVAGGLIIFIAQFALIGSLLVQSVRRRRAEQATRNSEERYRSVVDTQSDLICRFLPDSTLTFVNDAYCRFWDKTRQELLGHKFVELIPESSRHLVLERVSRLQTGIDSHEHEVVLADGTIGWHHWINHAILDERGRVIELQGVGRDITDRKRAQQEVGQLEARNRAILGAIPDLMFLLTKDGIYVDYYAPDESRLLLEPAQFLGRHMHDVLPPASAAAFDDGFARLATGETPVILEYGLEMPDGERQYEARMVSCSGDQVLAVVRDMTERKRAEHVLHETQSELARVSRLTALGEFAASIAHEVRQPLTSITINAKTCLRWLSSAAPDLAELRAALVDVVDAGQRADDVITRNRELFNDHTVQKVPIDLNDVIRDVTVLVRQRVQVSRIMLMTYVDGPLPPVNADRVELQQVLLNLISNSIDAMEGTDAGSKQIAISASVAGDGMVKVAVSDTGVGLKGVDMRRMFTISYTTKPRGTGVGLSISRAIVEAHGGQLWAEQNNGAGATFFFTLPVWSNAAVA
jgi:PAS domain S-box-containing protein